MNKNEQTAHCCDSLADNNDHNPRISIIIRFEPEMKNQIVLQKILADRANKEEADLLNQYPAELVKPVTQKLRNLISGIKNEANQSIAIFVCSVSGKVIYFTYNSYLSEFNRLHPLRPLKLID
ncbi:MAG TPA: hypothetical protein VFU62_11930 [Hanamia sp.]|jgi:hypothetical protein|nr:hypothetical protein [Hanamia sp.]